VISSATVLHRISMVRIASMNVVVDASDQVQVLFV